MKTIYDLKIHETLRVDCDIIGDDVVRNGHEYETYYVTRVANGWLYRFYSGNVPVSSTFVPFDNEWDPADG